MTFDSKKEATRALELAAMEQAGAITSLEFQPVFRIDVNGVHVCKYIADFMYVKRDGSTVVEDVKGMKTDVYKLKAKLMFAVRGIKVLET